jgi:hypothetical protein
VAEDSVLSDELLRQLMAVGQVDVLVGIPTLNNAATVGHVVHAVHGAFAKYFARERTVLINSDGGSDDGTPAVIRGESRDPSETLTVQHPLRTVHRISAPYHGVPGKGSALRQIFVAAELTQARAVAVLDPEVTSVTPEWIAALLGPIRHGSFDFVSPVYLRHPLDGPLITQLVRPLVRAAYGHEVLEPLAAEFGCSGTFVAHAIEQDVWDSELARYGIDLWVTGAALSGGFTCCQVPLGPRVVGPVSHARPGLPEVFQQVVGSLFRCLELHADYWVDREGATALPTVGSPPDAEILPPQVDARRLTESFCSDLQNLQAVLQPILSAETLSGLSRIAAGDCAALEYGDDLWVATVLEFFAAHHRTVMRRDHVTQALLPLYLGRAGSFLLQHAHSQPADVQAALDALGVRFERAKPDLVHGWRQSGN